MWLFAAVSVAIATPCFRAWLEALFAELTIIFFTYLRLVAVGLSLVLALALGFHGRRFLHRRDVEFPRPKVQAAVAHGVGASAVRSPRKRETQAPGRGLPRLQWKRGSRRRALLLRVKTTTSEIAGSGFHPPQLWTTTLFALAMLPIINSVMVGGGHGGGDSNDDSSAHLRGLKTDATAAAEMATYSAALVDDAAALTTLKQQLTTCKYSSGADCLNDVTQLSALGDYQQTSGYCVAFDAAYVNVTTPGASLPPQYFPIAVEDANAQGFANNFSEWSEGNQDRFQMDCPMLYEDTVLGAGEELLCCTERQFETLSLQMRELPGLCSSCQQNLRNLWCQSSCHPSNSLFLDVTQVRLMDGDIGHADEVFPAVEEATYYVGSELVRDLHDFCEADTAFTALVCGNDTEKCSPTGPDMLQYLGAYSFNAVGSPAQVNFTTMQQLSETEQEDTICPCGDEGSSNVTGCFQPMDTRLESCMNVCGALCAVSEDDSREYQTACYSTSNSSSSASSSDVGTVTTNSTVPSGSSSTADSKVAALLTELSGNVQSPSFAVLNYLLAVLAFFAATVLALGVAYSTRYGKKKRHSIVGGHQSLVTVGPGALSLVNLDELGGLGVVDHWLTTRLKRWGDFVATGNHPYYIVLLGLMLVICCSSGLVRLQLETDPMKLWAAEASDVFQKSTRFGETLGPVDRVERLVLVTKDGGGVTRSAYLKEAIRLQALVAENVIANSESDGGSVSMSDICLKDGSGSPCQVNAITQYFQNSMSHFELYATYGLEAQHLSNCANNPFRADMETCRELQTQVEASGASVPTSMSDCPCFSSFGTPMAELSTYLGGFSTEDLSPDVPTYLAEATALFSTALVVNYADAAKNERAIEWERAFITRMQMEAAESDLYDVFYSAGTSGEDAFAAASGLEIIFKAGVAGFAFMAVCVVLGLNCWKLDRHFFHTSKIGVGLLGVGCLLMAVTATLGLFAWTGLKLQLVTVVVFPLVTLAIGTGNIFLILNAVALKQEELRQEQRSLFMGLEDNDFGIHEITCVLLCEASGHIGPSLMLTATCECVIIAIAAYSAMPAAQWLAAFLAVGLVASVVLQMTMFLAIVALDKRRELSGTYDVLCCKRASFARRPRLSEDENTGATENSSFPGSSYVTPKLNLMDRFVTGYVRLLANKIVKVLVVFVFTSCTLGAIVSIETLHRGLPLTSFFPTDSYLHAYSRAVAKYDLSATQFPVYFVVEAGYERNPDGFNDLASDADTQAKLCSSKELCDDLSIPSILEELVTQGNGNVTFLKENAEVRSWLDDFWSFVSPATECCRVDPANNLTYSPLLPEDNSSEYVLTRSLLAPSCLAETTDVESLPQESFMSLFSMFSTAAAGPLCSYAAGTRYHGQFSIDSAPIPLMTDISTLHVILNGTGYGDEVTAFAYKLIGSIAAASGSFKKGQEADIAAYSQARHIAEWISDQTGVDVWVYSPGYLFLEQFRTVRRDAYVVIGVSVVAVFLLQGMVLGRFWYALAVAFIAAVTVVQVAGLMEPIGVPLNSLSVLSLSVAIAFSVGFSGHFARLFAKARSIKDETGSVPAGDACTKKALTQLLASWTLGVAIPKFVAIAALALVAAPVFQPAGDCFFRVLMSAAVCAWLNGVMLLPVGLSICVDAMQGRVRDVKPTNEEGGAYVRESPGSSYRGSSMDKY
ncbi:hypothetical protein BBJ28_00014430 [Nothophytophthora sp. Chile5]|nr:hypothetical protein BBJ28_00014430 [Nothophytophthora sp. Chile5]